jgi:RNA polymerase sigma-70 factor (ECF subfamily)
MQADDETLMAAVAAGDGAALAELCRRWEQPLFRLLARQGGGRDVDDLYQETWLRVVRAAGRFTRGRPFRPWLFQIAINCCRDWARRRRVDPLAHTAELPAEPSGGGTGRIDAALDAARLLAELPAAQREVVVLRYYHDLPEGEVAEILGCPPGTVKSRLHHAIARLVAAVGGRTPKAAARGARA